MYKEELNIPEQYQEDLKKAVEVLQIEGCKEIYLFGSLAAQKSRDSSDIDIGVKGCPVEKFFRIYSHLQDELRHRVDFVDFDQEPEFFQMLSSIDEVVRIG